MNDRITIADLLAAKRDGRKFEVATITVRPNSYRRPMCR